MKKIIDYLINNFWNILETHNSTLISFEGGTYVNNFSLHRLDQAEKVSELSIELFDIPIININTKFTKNKEFQSNFELLSKINTLVKSTHGLNDNVLSQYNNDIVFSGSTSSKWLKDDTPPDQLLKLDVDKKHNNFITSRETKLKICFNKKFQEMRDLKQILLNETTDRLRKLDKYKSEMKNLFGIVPDDDNAFNDVKWNSVEITRDLSIIEEDILSNEKNSICLVNENKETVENFICDSLFREEKLKEIMDGVLEIRWEDEIVKDIPKPFCLLYKNPLKFNEEDYKAIEVYQDKVEKLEIERQKYKTYLEFEINNLNSQIKADVINFDKKMENLAMEKIKIRSAILQEYLLRLNEKKRQFLKDYTSNQILLRTNNDLLLLKNEYKIIMNEIKNVELIILELKSKYENLNKRDKTFEGKFRNEFDYLKQPIVEHLLRQYKKRPRIDTITYLSVSCLTEMKKCLVSDEKSEILPQEYLNFLHSMDTIDAMPNNLPQQIDTICWQSLCRLRRNKVELEIKLKIAIIELADAEKTYSCLQKSSSLIQSKINSIKNILEEEKLKKLRSLNNSEVQLVLKFVQIEINLTGSLSDFKNITFISHKQFIELNNRIINEGKKKLTAIRALINLKKSTLYKNWKHECILKKIQHMKEHLLILRNTKILKRMQTYLVEKIEKKICYKDSKSCDMMLKSVEKKFERMLKEKEDNFLRLIKEIKYWRKMNAELTTRIELLSLKKTEESSYIKEDKLHQRNRTFKKNYLRSIMKRTRLVHNIKKSRNELLNLHTQLELLKWKTYPTLRLKNSPYYINNSLYKKY